MNREEVKIWNMAIEAAANEVRTHWNDPYYMVSQKQQAVRSARVLMGLKKPDMTQPPAPEPDLIECPQGCPGCSCHQNPPCGHCVSGHGEERKPGAK